MKPHSVVLASRNPGKLREIQQVLRDIPLRTIPLGELPDIPQPQETGQTFAQNARDKAAYYAHATGEWCLADDSGLEVDALGGAPGVRSARYAAQACPPEADRAAIDEANNAKLLSALEGVCDEKRTARFVCHLAMADPRRILIETFDTIEGRIGHAPKGHNGFGYDPLFFLPERGCTTAQLPPEEKNEISHRGKALRRFANLLRTLLQEEQEAEE